MAIVTQSPGTENGSASAKSIGGSDRRFNLEGLGLTLVVLGLALVFAWINPRFATLSNLANVLTQSSTYVIVAMGMTFVISKAGIDLSVGSLLALVTCVFFAMVDGGTHWSLALIVMFALAVALGALNGALVAFLAIPALIATLGTMVAFRGAALLHSAGELYFGLPAPILWLGQGHVAGVPVPILIAALFVAFSYWLFNHTSFGLHVRAVGGNRESARLAGVNVQRIEVATYALMGFAVALGGLLWMARIDGTQATMGTAMEIHVIASVIIGGTSLFGGKGKILWTLYGALFITLLDNSLNLIGLSYFLIMIVKGAVILSAAIMNVWKRKALKTT